MTGYQSASLYKRHTPPAERVTALLSQMTLSEKIGQMTQVEKNSITPEAVAAYGIGSVLSGGGGNPTPNTPETWARMTRRYQEAALRSRLGIPLLYGTDGVHGHNNVIGATIFPHNVGLGATRDPELAARIGRITAVELLATHVHWNFAPCVAVPQDIRWGRAYEGFGEQTGLVAQMGAAAIRGLQTAGDNDGLSHPLAVLACAKHYVGDGGTAWGSAGQYEWIEDNWQRAGSQYQIDQGETSGDEARLRAVHLPPYRAAIEAGVRSIMVSFSSWGGRKLHAHKYLLTDVLKGEMGFTGFLISDWMGIDQLDPDFYTCVVTAVNAGLDMIMVPFDYRRFISTLTQAVEKGDVSPTRIEDAARRILTVKQETGLFEHPFGDESLLPQVGSQAHRQVAREAVRQSLVLLKNEGALPLSRQTPRLLVAGAAADDVGLQCGGWTIEWQGQSGPVTPGATLLAGVRDMVAAETAVYYQPDGRFPAHLTADAGIVVLSEPPYAEGAGDRADLTLPASDIALIERVRSHCRRLIVILYSGRPLIITDCLPHCDAFIAAWLPGSEGQGISDVLFGDYPFSGKLPFTWPRSMNQIPVCPPEDSPLFPYGYGLTTNEGGEAI